MTEKQKIIDIKEAFDLLNNNWNPEDIDNMAIMVAGDIDDLIRKYVQKAKEDMPNGKNEVTLEKANEIMGKWNKCFDVVKNKLNEFDTKRMHDKSAHHIYNGLRFAYIEMCKFMSDLEESLLNEDGDKSG
jgi:hypothetical protein